MYGYVKSKRDQLVRKKYFDMILSSYDPLDWTQAERLEKLIPGLVESKVEVYEICQQQKAFWHKTSVSRDISPADFQRLVR